MYLYTYTQFKCSKLAKPPEPSKENPHSSFSGYKSLS